MSGRQRLGAMVNSLLLDMRDRKGWKALGYESFKEYGEKELGYQEAHIYRLVDAAEMSLQIGYSPIGESKQPSESQLRPLKAVPEDERKAMAVALAYPENEKRGRGNKSGLNPDFIGTDASYINKARFVLRNCRD